MHQIRIRPGLPPDPAEGANSAPPDPLAGLRILLLRGEGGGKVGREGKGRREEGRGEGKGKVVPSNVRDALTPLSRKWGITPSPESGGPIPLSPPPCSDAYEQTPSISIPHPTNLALFGHKITLFYRFNQGGSYYCRGGGSTQSRVLSPTAPLTFTTAKATAT